MVLYIWKFQLLFSTFSFILQSFLPSFLRILSLFPFSLLFFLVFFYVNFCWLPFVFPISFLSLKQFLFRFGYDLKSWSFWTCLLHRYYENWKKEKIEARQPHVEEFSEPGKIVNVKELKWKSQRSITLRAQLLWIPYWRQLASPHVSALDKLTSNRLNRIFFFFLLRKCAITRYSVIFWGSQSAILMSFHQSLAISWTERQHMQSFSLHVKTPLKRGFQCLFD